MIPCSIKYHSHVWCKFKVWRSSGQHWPDSSNLNKCVDQNCLFCKNWIVFVIKLWLESCSFPNYPSATIFTPALNPANAILNTTKSWSKGVSQPKCTFWVNLFISPTKIIDCMVPKLPQKTTPSMANLQINCKSMNLKRYTIVIQITIHWSSEDGPKTQVLHMNYQLTNELKLNASSL